MGRELKRVALDFDWPLHEVWQGFLNPYWQQHIECPHCAGRGSSPEGERLHQLWYGYIEFHPEDNGSVPFTPDDPYIREFATRNVGDLTPVQQLLFYGRAESQERLIQVEAERLCGLWNGQWGHHLSQDDVDALWADGRLYDFNPNWRENHNEGVPAPKAADVNQWSIRRMGHDSINSWICIRERLKKSGHDEYCKYCDGEGHSWPSEEVKTLYENWEKVEPPAGEGYQVWETVSEGSPISPVFPTKEALISWLLDQGYSEGAAEKFAEQGHAFSMVMVSKPEGNTLYNNIESLNMAQDGD